MPAALTADERGAFMRGVWQIKAGDLATRRTLLRGTADQLIARGAEIIIVGCTEAPLVIGPYHLAVPLIDSADVGAADRRLCPRLRGITDRYGAKNSRKGARAIGTRVAADRR